MHNRSSIFNFDTCIEFPSFTKATLLTLGILLGIRILYSVFDDKLAKISQSPEPLVSMLSYLKTGYQGKPKVLFLGSSRFISAIDSKLFAQVANLAPQDVINLSVESGGPWEALTIIRQNSNLLTSAGIAIVEIEPWMFNQNMLNPILNEPWQLSTSFHRWAAIGDRLQQEGTLQNLQLIFESVWPLYEKRTINSWILGSYAALNTSQDTLPVAGYHYNMEAAKSLASNKAFSAPVIVHTHMHNFEFSSAVANYLETLILTLQKYNIRIVIVQPPVRQEYIETIYQNQQYKTGYNEILQFLNQLQNQYKMNLVLWETAADCNWDDTIFVDYGHFTLSGSQRFTKKIFDTLTSDYSLRTQ